MYHEETAYYWRKNAKQNPQFMLICFFKENPILIHKRDGFLQEGDKVIKGSNDFFKYCTFCTLPI